MKKISVMVLMLILCGCEIKELESRDFVLEIFVDKPQNYSCSVGIAEFSEEENNSTIKTTLKEGSGITIANSLDSIDDYSSGQLYYGHTQLCIISLNALEEENTLKEMVDLSERNNELSRRIIVLATDTMEECKNTEDIDIYDFVNGYFSGSGKYKGRSFMVDMGRLTKQLIETGNGLIPIINVNDEEISINSCALIKSNKLCGIAEQEQAKGLLWLSEWEMAEDTVNLTIENIPVVIRLKEKKIEKKPMEDKLIINIEAEGKVFEYSLGKNIPAQNIEHAAAKKLEEKINSSLKLLQGDLSVDCIGITESYRKDNYGVYMNNINNIDEFFKELRVELNVNVKISESSSIG